MNPHSLQSSVPVPSPTLPLVSMIMPTYGRAAKQPELLNEAVYWCVRQSYPNIEVLVLNDAPEQTLVCDHPRVRVINWPERLPNLGEKMNLGVLLAAGSICMPAEDDDISLPWRAEQAVDALQTSDYFDPGYWWYAPNGLPMQPDGNGQGHNCSAYRRDVFLGRYASVILGHDREATNYARSQLRVSPHRLIGKADQISYIYRWGVSTMHLSGHHNPEQGWTNFYPGLPGTYQIVPTVRVDWVAEVQRALTI